MFTRKVLTLMVAVALGLVSLGFVLAEDPKPIIPPVTAANPPPIPTQAAPKPAHPMMVMPPTALLVAGEKRSNPFAANLKPGEKQVMIEVTCLEMGIDVVSEIGLTADRPKNAENSSLLVTCLSPRERKMFEALMRAKTKEGGVDILSRPQLCIADGQTGFCQIGGQVPQMTGFDTNAKDGKGVPVVTYATIGLTLKVTPKVSKDNGYIHLLLEPQRARIVDLGNALDNLALPFQAATSASAQGVQFPAKQGVETIQATTVESVQLTTSVVLPTDGTVVIGKKGEVHTATQTKNLETGTTVTERGTTTNMMLWVITAHVIVGNPNTK
jgi:hypothetical protein